MKGAPMQQPQQTQQCPPQQTPEQLKMQAEGMRASIQMQSQASLYAYRQGMAKEIAGPLEAVVGFAFVASVVIHLARKAIAAGIEKNADDNRANVEIAKHAADKAKAEMLERAEDEDEHA